MQETGSDDKPLTLEEYDLDKRAGTTIVYMRIAPCAPPCPPTHPPQLESKHADMFAPFASIRRLRARACTPGGLSPAVYSVIVGTT